MRRADIEGRAERRPSGNNVGINIPDVVTRRGGGGNAIVLYSGGAQYRNLINDAIFRAIRGQMGECYQFFGMSACVLGLISQIVYFILRKHWGQ